MAEVPGLDECMKPMAAASPELGGSAGIIRLSALRRLWWALCALSVIACAKTRVTTVRDPDYARRSFHAPAVLAQSADLQQRQLLEDAMVAELSKRGIVARSTTQLVPPTREYSQGDYLAALSAAGVDSLIVISGESGVTESYVPISGATTTTTGTIRSTSYGAEYQSRSNTNLQGGYYVHRPWANVTTVLVDLEAGKQAWVASSETAGNGYADFDDVRKSYCKAVAKRLVDEHVLSSQGSAEGDEPSPAVPVTTPAPPAEARAETASEEPQQETQAVPFAAAAALPSPSASATGATAASPSDQSGEAGDGTAETLSTASLRLEPAMAREDAVKLLGTPTTTAFGAAAKADAKGVPNALVWRYESSSRSLVLVFEKRGTWQLASWYWKP